MTGKKKTDCSAHEINFVSKFYITKNQCIDPTEKVVTLIFYYICSQLFPTLKE